MVISTMGPKAEKKRNIFVSGFGQIFYFSVGRSGEKNFDSIIFFYYFISMEELLKKEYLKGKSKKKEEFF